MPKLLRLFRISVVAATSVSFLTIANASQTRSHDELPIPGHPPLTQEVVAQATHFFGWLLDARLTDEQRAEFRESLVRSWKGHRQDEIDSTMNVLNFADQVNQKKPEEREVIREALCQKYLALVRQTPNNVLSRWVLNIYESAHRPIAAGNPPLTLQVADAYAEFVSFYLAEATGQKAFEANRHFKDALARGLAQQYGSYAPEQQRQFSQIPLLWDVLRLKWAQLPEADRAKYRKEWAGSARQLLAASQTQSAGAVSSSSAGSSSLDAYVASNSERLFVKSMSQSSFASTMSMHLNMWK